MNRKYYILPAEHCADAIAKYEAAKAAAMASEKTILAEYFGAGILRRGSIGIGFAYVDPVDMSGFCQPQKMEGYWISKPKKNTIRGKRVQAQLDEYCGLMEVWQWALEHALGIYSVSFCRRMQVFNYVVARPLNDGRVVVSWPTEADIALPVHAVEISHAEYFALVPEKEPA